MMLTINFRSLATLVGGLFFLALNTVVGQPQPANETVQLGNDNPRRGTNFVEKQVGPSRGGETEYHRKITIRDARRDEVRELDVEYTNEAGSLYRVRFSSGNVTVTWVRDNRAHTFSAAELADPAVFELNKSLREIEELPMRPLQESDFEKDDLYETMYFIARDMAAHRAFNPLRQLLGRATRFRTGTVVNVPVRDIPLDYFLFPSYYGVSIANTTALTDEWRRTAKSLRMTVLGRDNDDEAADGASEFVAVAFELVVGETERRINGGTVENMAEREITYRGKIYFHPRTGFIQRLDAEGTGTRTLPDGTTEAITAKLSRHFKY